MSKITRARRLAPCAAWLALLACAFAFAQSLAIIELRHRPAEQLLPLVQPLVGAGGAVSGSGFQLFVRAAPANLAQIRQVVESLDRAQRNLVILVRQEAGASSAASGVGTQVTAQPGASGARIGLYNGTGTAEDSIAQRITVLEGNPAWIQSGTSTLVPQRTVTRTPGAVVVQQGSIQRDYNSGFSVTPRVRGDTVFLDIGAQRDTAVVNGPPGQGAGAASVNRVVTTVSGKLGEWIELGGDSSAYSRAGSGVLARSSDAGLRERRVAVKVEDAR